MNDPSRTFTIPSVPQIALELAAALISSGSVAIGGSTNEAKAEQALELYEALKVEAMKRVK